MSHREQLLHWEDFKAGVTVEFGAFEVTADDIIAFAREFDPDPAHLDEVAARALPARGLTASDWHVSAMQMRMLCDDYLLRAAGAGAPAIEYVRWFGEVRPGDVLCSRRMPIETRASRSRPRVGIVRMLLDVFNQRGEKVLSWLPVQLVDRRDPTAEPPPPASVPHLERAEPDRRAPPALAADRAPASQGAFEDFAVGHETRLGSHAFTTEGVLGFATRFNPQYFHADEKAAAASLYGGLIASGWHTAAVWNRLFVTHHQRVAAAPAGARPAAFGPSIAVLDMKWPGPVRPGDTIDYTTRVSEVREDGEFPQWGIVASRNEGFNQRGEAVLSLTHETWVERRGGPGKA